MHPHPHSKVVLYLYFLLCGVFVLIFEGAFVLIFGGIFVLVLQVGFLFVFKEVFEVVFMLVFIFGKSGLSYPSRNSC